MPLFMREKKMMTWFLKFLFEGATFSGLLGASFSEYGTFCIVAFLFSLYLVVFCNMSISPIEWVCFVEVWPVFSPLPSFHLSHCCSCHFISQLPTACVTKEYLKTVVFIYSVLFAFLRVLIFHCVLLWVCMRVEICMLTVLCVCL